MRKKLTYVTAGIRVSSLEPASLLAASIVPTKVKVNTVVVEDYKAGFTDSDGNDFKEVNFD